MNLETRKIGLINWITQISDEDTINQIDRIRTDESNWFANLPDSVKDEIIEYLNTEWSFKEVEQFVRNVLDITKHISTFPQMFPEFNDCKIRKTLINSNISLFYKVLDKQIELLIFWNNKQSPTKLKNILN